MRAALLCLMLAIAAPCAFARTGTVHRCIGEHGEISFSDAPCAGAAASSPVSAPAAISPDGGRAKDTCPASAEALRDVVADAFTRRDANTLAGIMRWDGVGGAAAAERMRELADLTGRPLLGIELGAADDAGADTDARPATNEPAPEPARPEGGFLVVRIGSLAGGAGEHEFRLTPAGGCYWLDW